MSLRLQLRVYTGNEQDRSKQLGSTIVKRQLVR